MKLFDKVRPFFKEDISFRGLILKHIEVEGLTHEEYCNKYNLDKSRLRGWLYSGRNKSHFKSIMLLCAGIIGWVLSLDHLEQEKLLKELKN